MPLWEGSRWWLAETVRVVLAFKGIIYFERRVRANGSRFQPAAALLPVEKALFLLKPCLLICKQSRLKKLERLLAYLRFSSGSRQCRHSQQLGRPVSLWEGQPKAESGELFRAEHHVPFWATFWEPYASSWWSQRQNIIVTLVQQASSASQPMIKCAR